MEQILAQIVGGALGGTATGKAVPATNMGGLGNVIAGALGGVGGGQILGSLLGSGATAAAATGGIDIATIASNLVGGGVAGAVVQIVVGLIIKKMRGA